MYILLDLLKNPNPTNTAPRRHKGRRARNHHHPAEHLQPRKAPVHHVRDQGPADRVPRERGDCDDGEEGAVADADLAHVRDLRDQGRGQGDEGAGAEAVQRAEDDGGGVAAGGEPQGQHEDGGEVGRQDHHIEAAEAVGGVAGEGAAEDAVASI